MKMNYDYDKDKQEWRELNKAIDDIPLYMKDWYWDLVCDSSDEWKVICVKKNDQIEAAFPFKYTKRKGMWFIELPWQVACAGIWYKNREIVNKEKALKYLTDIIHEIVDRLPPYDCFQVNFNYLLWTWHPFYWLGFDATPNYTSIISPATTTIKSNIVKKRRERINRAEKRFNIKTNAIMPQEYWDFFEKSYADRGRTINCSKDKFIKLIAGLLNHDACEIRTVYDEQDRLIAENILLKDSDRMYNQFGTQLNKEYTDATSYALYDGIQSCVNEHKCFDFEGSMIQGVCEFNVSWNPEFEVNYKITKYSRKYRMLNSIREFCRAIKNK